MPTETVPPDAPILSRVRIEHAQAMEDLEARLLEHAEHPETVKRALADVVGSDDVGKAVHRERTLRTARTTVDREVAEADLRLPPEREDYTLASYRAEDRPPKVERIEQLQRAGHRTALVASYKTGKTTLHADLTRALVDGGKFLGRFAVKPPKGRVGVWNAEMDSEDYEDYEEYEEYLVDAGVSHEARVALRGGTHCF
jgi:hypothetical protein